MPFRHVHTVGKLRKQIDIKLQGKNVIDKIFELYNEFWRTNYKVEDFLDSYITSQQSFFCDKKTFENIMKFVSYIIENKIAESNNTWRLPATILERVFGIALLLEKNVKVIPIPLSHQNMQLWEDNLSLYKKIIIKIKAFLKGIIYENFKKNNKK